MRSVRTREIRADYDRTSIVVYQAYSPSIGRPAVEHGRFVPPFSRTRMTWIKPSFLWLMERSGWARKAGQEMVLAVRISRAGWEEALSQAVLTSPDRRVHPDADAWRAEFRRATVHVQWDPERTLRGGTLDARSIQVGLSRHVIRASAGGRFSVRVSTDSSVYHWRIASRFGRARSRRLSLAAGIPGRYTLIVFARGHSDRAKLIVR